MSSDWILQERGKWVDLYISRNDPSRHRRVSRFIDQLGVLTLNKHFFDALSSVELGEISIDIVSQAPKVFSLLDNGEIKSVLRSLLRKAPGLEASILAYLVGSYFSRLEALQILDELLCRNDICRENVCDVIKSLDVNSTGQVNDTGQPKHGEEVNPTGQP